MDLILSATSPTNQSPFWVTINFKEPMDAFEAGDAFSALNITNGTASNLTGNDGDQFWTFQVTPSSDGVTVLMSIPAGSFINSGGPNEASNNLQVEYDATGPQPTINSSETDPTNTSPFNVTIDFDQSVGAGVVSQVIVGNGNVTNTTDNGDGTWTLEITPTGDGTVTVDVPSGIYNDAASNPNDPATWNIEYDGTPPQPSISTIETDPTKNSPFNITVDFGESVDAAVVGQITVTNGSVTNTTDNGDGTWTLEITPTADGTVTVDVPASIYQDTAGNNNNSATWNIEYDGTPPQPSISSLEADPTNNSPFNVTIDFGQNVGAAVVGQVNVGNGNVTNTTDNGDGTWTLEITPTADGSVTVDVPAAIYQDTAGNDNNSASWSIEYDGTSPQPSISTTESDPTNNDPFNITIDFGESVDAAVVGQVTVTNGTVTNTTDNGNGTWTLEIDPTSDGTVTVDVPAGIYNDTAGNPNNSATWNIEYDGTPPQPSISSLEADPTNNSPFNVTIDFGQNVGAAVVGQVIVGNGNVTNATDNGDGTWTLEIDPTSDGAVTVDVPAGIYQDTAGNPNNSASWSIQFDGTPPQPSISTTEPDPTNSDPFDITIDFGQSVGAAVVGQVIVGNGNVTNTTDNGDGTWTLEIDPTSDGAVTVDVPAAIYQDTAGNPNNSASWSIEYDGTSPQPSISTTESDPTNNDPFNITIDFGETVDAAVVGQITVTNGSVTNTTDNGDGTWTLEIGPTADGTVTINVPAGIYTDTAGNPNNATSWSIIYDGTPPQPSISSTESDPTNNDPFDITIDFGQSVDAAVVGQVNVGNGNVTNTTDNGDGTWTLEIDPTSDGAVTVDVPAGIYQDTAGNPNNSASWSIQFDGTPPQPSISTTESDPTNNDPFNITIDFGQNVDAAVVGQVNVGNGNVTNTTDNGDGTWTLEIDPTSDGAVTVDVPAGIYQDTAGNPNNSASWNIEYDGTPPQPSISTTEPDPTNSDPFDITIDFEENVDAAVVGQVNVGNGNVTNTTDNGDGTWTLEIDPTTDGPVTVDVPAGIYTDAAGNPNNSTSWSIVFDDTPPQPVITSAESGFTNCDPFEIQIDFDEEVTSAIVTGAVVVTNGTILNATAIVGNQVWTLQIAPAGPGPVTISVPASLYQDDAGNFNLASNVWTITADCTGPNPVISSDELDPTDNTPFYIMIDFDEGVDIGIVNQVNVSNGNVTNTSGSAGDSIWILEITPTTNDGVISVEVPAGIYTDTVGNPNTVANWSINYKVPVAGGKDVVMLMDFSNSMSFDVTIEGETNGKMHFMRPAIHQFIDEWNVFAGPDDRYGMVWYKSSAGKVNPTMDYLHINDMHNKVDALATGGVTAMGPGLGLTLLDLLKSDQTNAQYGRDRDVVMFADGQDNVQPLVSSSASSFNVTAQNNGGYPHALGDVQVNQGGPDNIPIHTIGIGNNGSWLDELNNISNVSGGLPFANSGNQIWPLTGNAFEDILCEIYNTCSPQVIYRHRGLLPVPDESNTQNIESFFLDSGIDKILICLSWLGDTPLKLRLKKNGKYIYDFDEVIRRDEYNYVIVVLTLPHFRFHRHKQFPFSKISDLMGKIHSASNKAEDFTKYNIKDIIDRKISASIIANILGEVIDAEGTWEVVIERTDSSSEEQVHYNLSVIGDETGIRYQIMKEIRERLTGQYLDLGINVSEFNQPVRHILEASVKITKPRYAAANILDKYRNAAKHSMSTASPNIEESGIAAVMESLQKNPIAALELNQRITEKVDLKPVFSKKIIEGSLRGKYQLKVPGIYNLEYKIRGIGLKNGVFERIVTKSVFVKASVSRKHSTIILKPTYKPGRIRMIIKPRDQYCNLIGPGFANTVKADLVPNKNLIVRDNLDGTYTVDIDYIKNPKVQFSKLRLKFLDRTIFCNYVQKKK